MTDTKLLQPNQISRAAYKCDCTERKILFYAALKVQKDHYQFCKMEMAGYVAKFRISEMLKALNIPNRSENRNIIKNAINTIAQNTITITNTDRRLNVLNWLQQGVFDADTNTIELVFTDSIGRMFCECREQFSELSPLVIGSLKSYYSMRYYELAMSFRGLKPWEFTLTLEQIRAMYQINGYTDAKDGTNNFIRKVIMSPIAELNKVNTDFLITVDKIADSNDKRKISAFRFRCQTLKTTKRAKILPNDNAAQKLRKQIVNERAEAEAERSPIERIKALYPDEFARRVAQRKLENPIELQANSEYYAYKSMIVDEYTI